MRPLKVYFFGTVILGIHLVSVSLASCGKLPDWKGIGTVTGKRTVYKGALNKSTEPDLEACYLTVEFQRGSVDGLALSSTLCQQAQIGSHLKVSVQSNCCGDGGRGCGLHWIDAQWKDQRGARLIFTDY
jgi:hypothetical protein